MKHIWSGGCARPPPNLLERLVQTPPRSYCSFTGETGVPEEKHQTLDILFSFKEDESKRDEGEK